MLSVPLDDSATLCYLNIWPQSPLLPVASQLPLNSFKLCPAPVGFMSLGFWDAGLFLLLFLLFKRIVETKPNISQVSPKLSIWDDPELLIFLPLPPES